MLRSTKGWSSEWAKAPSSSSAASLSPHSCVSSKIQHHVQTSASSLALYFLFSYSQWSIGYPRMNWKLTRMISAGSLMTTSYWRQPSHLPSSSWHVAAFAVSSWAPTSAYNWLLVKSIVYRCGNCANNKLRTINISNNNSNCRMVKLPQAPMLKESS